MTDFVSAVFPMLENSNAILKLVVFDFGIQWLGYALASIWKTEKFYDVFGSITFIVLTYLNFEWHDVGHPRQGIQTACICIWALRLGLFLFIRVMKRGKDRRFDQIKVNPLKFFSAWTIQGVWIFITILPTILCVKNGRQRIIGWRDYIGWGVWVVGLFVETVADYQKTSFANQPANKDKFICSGLWSLCRHPNYFGEILLWFGLYISASSTFHSWEYLTVLCPVFDYLLITKLSGIPILEKYAIKKWGTLPQYQQYLRNTPSLIPFWY